MHAAADSRRNCLKIGRSAKELALSIRSFHRSGTFEEIGPDGYTFNERRILDEMYGAYTGVKSTVGKVASLFKISKLEVISAMKKFKK